MSSWLAEDPELLEAALEIVETWDVGYLPVEEPWASSTGSDSDSASTTSHSNRDGSGSSSSSLVDSPISGSALRVTQLAATSTSSEDDGSSSVGLRRRLQPSTLTSTHHRRRKEICSLRGKVAELERQLQLLTRTTRAAGAADGTRSETSRARASMWRDIALRQRQWRSASEADQAKLRKRVDAHTLVARDMIKLVQKAHRLEDDETVRSLRRLRSMPKGVLQVQQVDQLMRVAELYANMNLFLTHPKFYDGTMKFIDVQMREVQRQEFVLEVSEAWTIPFDEHHVLDALWKYALRRQTEALCAPEYLLDANLQVQDTELVSHFSAQAKIGVAKGSFAGRTVIKRFSRTGTSPSAMISSVWFTPSETDPGDLQGIGNEGLSCVRVVPVVFEGSEQPVSRVMVTERFNITFGERFDGNHLATSYMNITLGKMKNNIVVMHETVETLLLAAH